MNLPFVKCAKRVDLGWPPLSLPQVLAAARAYQQLRGYTMCAPMFGLVVRHLDVALMSLNADMRARNFCEWLRPYFGTYLIRGGAP